MPDDLALGRGALGVAAAGAQAKPTKRRFLIMGMLFITVVINYLDRSNLSIASPHLSAQFHLSPTQMGLIFSAFGWIYRPMCLPRRLAGRPHQAADFLSGDHLPVVAGDLRLRRVHRLRHADRAPPAGWPFEVPSFLINNRIATTWFGEHERATCVARLYGGGICRPRLPAAGAGLAADHLRLALGVLRYRDGGRDLGGDLLPAATAIRAAMKGINAAEIGLIASSGGIPDLSDRIKARTSTREDGSLWRNLARGVRPAQAVGHLYRRVRLGDDEHLLPDLVPDLSRPLSAFHLHQGGLLRFGAVLAGVLRSDLLRAAVGFLRPPRASASVLRARHRSSAAWRSPRSSSAPISSTARRW